MNSDKLFEELQKHIALSEAAIGERAYLLWEQDHRPEGAGEEYWLAAEKQLREENAERIIKQVISPAVQEVAFKLDEETKSYIKDACKTANGMVKSALERDQFVMPDGVRFYRRLQKFGTKDYEEFVVFEESPKIRTLLIDMGYHTGRINKVSRNNRHDYIPKNHQKISLAIPYVCYLVRFREKKIAGLQYFFRKAPLKTLDDILYQSHLPNSDDDGKPCVPWPDSWRGEGPAAMPHKSLPDRIKMVISLFWETEFNYSLSEKVPTDDNISSFEKWAEMTKENPLFVLNAHWVPSNRNLSSMLGLFANEPQVTDEMQVISSRFTRTAAEILTLNLPKKPYVDARYRDETI
jgi:hypothetical protein